MHPRPFAYLKGVTSRDCKKQKKKQRLFRVNAGEVDKQTWTTISEVSNGGGVGLRCRAKFCPATPLKGSGDSFKEFDDGSKVNGSGGMVAGGDMVLTISEVVAPILGCSVSF